MGMKGLESLIGKLRGGVNRVDKKLNSALVRIGVEWQADAKRRCPVDTGNLRNQILYEVGYSGVDSHYVAVGSNVPYAVFVEYGTEHIAGGKVKALGRDPGITDAQAIKIWPAKNEGLLKGDGTATKAFERLATKVASGGAQEQMPFLRPSFMAKRDKYIKMIADAISL